MFRSSHLTLTLVLVVNSGCGGGFQSVPHNASQPLSGIATGYSAMAANSSFSHTSVNIRPRHSQKCLDVPGLSTADGVAIDQWDCVSGGQLNELWDLIPIGDAFQIVSKISGKCLDVRGVSQENLAPLQQYQCLGAQQTNQLFRINSIADGFFQLVAVHSGKCLDISAASQTNGAELIQYQCHGGYNQQFQISEVPAPAQNRGPVRCNMNIDTQYRCVGTGSLPLFRYVFLGQTDLATCRDLCAQQGRGTCQFSEQIGPGNCLFATILPGETCSYDSLGRYRSFNLVSVPPYHDSLGAFGTPRYPNVWLRAYAGVCE